MNGSVHESGALRVAFIGAGAMAREHMRAFAAQPNVRIIGVHSRTRDKAVRLAEEFGIPVVANGIGDLYRNARPSLVVVAVNVTSARDVLREVIEYGVPILTEKPIALDCAHSRELLELSEEYRCRVWVGLNRRCYSSTLAARQSLETVEGIRIIEVRDQQDLDVVSRIGHPPRVLRNWMYANSIHLVDYLRIFGRGEILEVEVRGTPNTNTPGLVQATLLYDSGDVGLYTAVWNAPGPWACSVTSAALRWDMQPLEMARCTPRGSRQANEFEVDPHDTTFKAGFYRQAREICHAVIDGNEPLVPSIEDAMKTTELVEKLYEHEV